MSGMYSRPTPSKKPPAQRPDAPVDAAPPSRDDRLPRMTAEDLAAADRLDRAMPTARERHSAAAQREMDRLLGSDITSYREHSAYLAPRDLARRGFDVQAGMLEYAGVPLYPEAVLNDGSKWSQSAEGNALRATLIPGYAEAFNAWITRAIAAGPYHADRGSHAASLLPPHERNALGGGLTTGGGFLTPPQLLAEILSARAAVAVVRPLVRAVPTTSGELQAPVAKNHASTPDLYNSAFVGGWYGETEEISFNSTLEFEMANIPLRKARLATKVGNDLIADAEGLLGWLAAAGGENLAALEDKGFLVGSDTENQPRGIIPAYSGSPRDVEGTTANTISNTDASPGSAPKLIDLQADLPSQYRRNARWFMRGETEAAIRKLINADGSYLWPRVDGTFQGDLIDHSDFLPATGADGARAIVYGDLRAAALIAEKPGIAVQVASELYTEDEQAVIYLKSRSAIVLINERAMKIGAV